VLHRRLALALLLVIMSTSVANARERRWSLFAGGMALFLSGYALDIGLSYGLDHRPAATSFIPVFGPIVQMGDSWAMVPASKSGNAQVDAQANPRIDDANHTIQEVAYAVLAVDFALQLAGATMLVVGVIGSDDHRADRVSVSVAPTGNGVRLRIRF
jgi:hypothetical protein